MTLKIVTVIGARPQFIKAATVSRAVARTDGIEEILVHTGQHYDANMSDIFFDEMGIADPAHHLNISGGTHGVMTGRMLSAIEAVLLAEKPDMLLVYGDTNSTLAGALAAAKLHIPVAHVEAGLRSFNMAMPEEVNRRLTDHCATLLFTPTATADVNLADEGIDPARVHQVGDVMFDAALIFGEAARTQGTMLKDLDLTPGGYVLATVHRQENTDDPARLQRVLSGLQAVARDMPVVLPLHPRTKGCVTKEGMDHLLDGLTIIDPQSYVGMVELEQGAAVIATDSGGVQKEAFFHGVPCVTLRDETEWIELIDAGWNRLAVPGDPSTDVAAAVRAVMGAKGRDVTPYGDGQAADKIVAVIMAHLTKGTAS
tara:strand:- start:1711 stop:2820 length:1110 start_codon:yes stop_codon:yes gene_type:complete